MLKALRNFAQPGTSSSRARAILTESNFQKIDLSKESASNFSSVRARPVQTVSNFEVISITDGVFIPSYRTKLVKNQEITEPQVKETTVQIYEVELEMLMQTTKGHILTTRDNTFFVWQGFETFKGFKKFWISLDPQKIEICNMQLEISGNVVELIA
jgi:DNA-binding cell septation regulator SpoVG